MAPVDYLVPIHAVRARLGQATILLHPVRAWVFSALAQRVLRFASVQLAIAQQGSVLIDRRVLVAVALLVCPGQIRR